MCLKRLFALSTLLIFNVFTLIGAPPLLAPSDVHKVMDQLFQFHIDQKEISPLLLKRSLKIYLTQFDPNHAYLLSDEASPYLHPNKPYLVTMLRDYQAGKFPAYFALNQAVKKSIHRARDWRQEWMQHPEELIAEAREVSFESFSERPYPKSLSELEMRHRDQFVRLIAFHIEQLSGTVPPEKQSLLITLCEKRLALLENPYLGLDENGQAMTYQQQEHHVILQTLKSLAHSMDAHTAFYSPEEAYAMKVQLEKGMCGIGVVLQEGVQGITVADLVKGGPAELGGHLQTGDTIVEVDGESVKEYSFKKVLEVLRGKEGSKAVLGIERNQDFFRVELTRRQITIEDKRVDVSSVPHGEGVIGKITLHSFYEGDGGINSEKDLRAAITELKEQGNLQGLVLDMRDNGGGFLSQAVRVSGLFINNGVVVISKYSDGSVKYYRAVDGKSFYNGPLVILTSRGSASATEIVAQTLQDYGVAIVIGDSQTYGKGTIQHQTVTNDRTAAFFKVTIGRYYTASGKSTQITGVKADIVVPTALEFEEIGEAHLDFPLPPDQVAPAFDDRLADIDPYARKWFGKYYLPDLQPRVDTWRVMLPTLKKNSQERLKKNEDFQRFLTQVKCKEKECESEGDLQMDEAVNVVRDMIQLKSRQ